MQYRELFLKSCGEEYHYIPALNANPDHITALCELIKLHTQGWPEFSTQWDTQQETKNTASRTKAALIAGSKR